MTLLESLANLSEIIGAIAVVVSLVYLAVQIRQNTAAQRTENFSHALDRIAAIQAKLSEDHDRAVIFSKGVEDPSRLTPTERMQFTWSMYEFFGALEFMFLASQRSAIPDDVWKRWSLAAAWWLSFPGVQIFWEYRPIPFTDSFTSFIDALVENNPTNIETVQRYRDFVSRGNQQQ